MSVQIRVDHAYWSTMPVSHYICNTLTGLGQARDAHPWALDGYDFTKFNDGDVVVERAKPEVRMPMDFGHVMNGLAAGVDFTVMFSNGHGKIFWTKT